VNRKNPPRKATFGDYFDLQGGVPNISFDEEKGIWLIRHNYREDQVEVKTHIPPSERGTVVIGNIEYEVAKLFEFEGKPCERQSRMGGGEGYNRRK